MAKITLSKDEFADLVVAYLFHKMTKNEEISSTNEHFEEFIERMRSMGLKAKSTNYYISMNPRVRMQFRRIKKVFSPENKNERSTIVIENKEED